MILTVTITPEAGKKFSEAPAVTADNATASIPAASADGVYTCELTGFTGNAVITVSGTAKQDNFTAKLDVTGLNGAVASLSKKEDILSEEIVTLTITPEAGKKFSEAPTLTAVNVTASFPVADSDGIYTCEITNFTDNAEIIIRGTAQQPAPEQSVPKQPDLEQTKDSVQTFPKTGDDNSIILLILGASICFCGVTYFSRGKKIQKD